MWGDQRSLEAAAMIPKDRMAPVIATPNGAPLCNISADKRMPPQPIRIKITDRTDIRASKNLARALKISATNFRHLSTFIGQIALVLHLLVTYQQIHRTYVQYNILEHESQVCYTEAIKWPVLKLFSSF